MNPYLTIHEFISDYYANAGVISGNCSPWKLIQALEMFQSNYESQKSELTQRSSRLRGILNYIDDLDKEVIKVKSNVSQLKTKLTFAKSNLEANEVEIDVKSSALEDH